MDEDNPRDAKRRKTNSVDAEHSSRNSPFSLLDDDSLRAVLLRTNGSDHRNLNLCCKRIRHALNSTVYRKERSDLGWAEVKVELLDSFEQYKREQKEIREEMDERGNAPSRNDTEFREEFDRLGRKGEYNDHSFHGDNLRVIVDGWPLQKERSTEEERASNINSEFHLSVQLIPRRASYFYQICDALSGDLADLGTTLFTNNGYPRVECLKDALQHNDTRKPLLYISFFTLPIHYRATCSTVGPLILKKLLKLFKDEYSIAIYIPCGRAQYDAEDQAIEDRERHNHRHPEAEPTDEEIISEEKRDERYRKLTHLDMRQFFRAGFHQVNDTIVVNKNMNSFLYVTPQGVLSSILTEQEALDRQIASPPPPPRKKMGLPKNLFNLVKEKCSIYSNLMQNLDAIFRARASGSEGEELAFRVRQLKATLRRHGLSVSDLELSGEGHGPIIEKLTDSTSDAIESLLSQSEANEDRFKVILDSDAFHVCAANENLDFIKTLVKFLPEPRRQRSIALNDADMDGFTPLMICARKISQKNLDPNVAKKSRLFVESMISLGADKSVIHSKTGLSALGVFREGRGSVRTFNAMFGFCLEPAEVLRGGEADRIEQILEPDEGPTKSDDAIRYIDNDGNDDDEEEP
eukprot:CAMPEP_0116155326 /NCGR_PEP_ID=MMETSP0329-20121206/22249_1 /TAXON_ID=697910 /ORGANISM="Pseudo-nitzschia arenysensis, Strain B593" /LENGTH=633 /DNA_ID=CAMNT_0003652355 /DNA_START=85 /DNA_END=1983 /DNA_ORIENTATION=-